MPEEAGCQAALLFISEFVIDHGRDLHQRRARSLLVVVVVVCP